MAMSKLPKEFHESVGGGVRVFVEEHYDPNKPSIVYVSPLDDKGILINRETYDQYKEKEPGQSLFSKIRVHGAIDCPDGIPTFDDNGPVDMDF